MKDLDHITSWDQFDLLMIEQPLWYDDFYFHSMLQKRLHTPICLDESIRNRRDALAAIDMESCRIINIKVGRVGGFSEAIAIHNAAEERGIPVWCGGMLETGIGRAHNIALSSLPNFSLPGDVSASSRYWAQDIIEPAGDRQPQGRDHCPDGRGPRLRGAARPHRGSYSAPPDALRQGSRHRLIGITAPAAASPAANESHPDSSWVRSVWKSARLRA